jgi:adenine phosphoribosyltransferase
VSRPDLVQAAPSTDAQEARVKDLKALIRDIPNFPKPGIIFRDITPLLADATALRTVVDQLAEPYRGRVDTVLGIESRGFIFGAPLAYALGVGLAVVRKPGKLPSETFAAQYALEYGNDSLEIHRDAFGHPCRVLVVDDLLATGGTASAAIELVSRLDGQVVACAFVIELTALNGRARLRPHAVSSLLQYSDG